MSLKFFAYEAVLFTAAGGGSGGGGGLLAALALAAVHRQGLRHGHALAADVFGLGARVQPCSCLSFRCFGGRLKAVVNRVLGRAASQLNAFDQSD